MRADSNMHPGHADLSLLGKLFNIEQSLFRPLMEAICIDSHQLISGEVIFGGDVLFLAEGVVSSYFRLPLNELVAVLNQKSTSETAFIKIGIGAFSRQSNFLLQPKACHMYS